MTGRRDEIVEAALAVAQERGLEATTMRAVAERLGGSVMGLYRHVPTKDALLDALVGRLLAEVDAGDVEAPWPDRLQHLAAQVFDLALRHPTVVPLLLVRAYAAPSAVRVVTATSELLRDAGVPAEDVPRLERMVATFLLGYATSAANGAFWADPVATEPPPTGQRRAPGLDAEQERIWRAELAADVADLVAVVERAASAQAPAVDVDGPRAAPGGRRSR